jgi:signal transduction histidine kinase
MDHPEIEKFRPTNNRAFGVLAVLAGAVIPVLWAVDRNAGIPGWLVWASLLFGVLAFGSMLLPALWVTPERLVLRNMFETVSIPLVAVEQVAVRQVTAVRAGEKRYVSSAVGKNWRQALRGNRSAEADPTAPKPANPHDIAYADFVQQRIYERAIEERQRLGIANSSDEQLEAAAGIERRPMWPMIAAAAACVLGFVVAIFL